MARQVAEPVLLLILRSACLPGNVVKPLDWPGAVAETAGLGSPLPALLTTATILTELLAPIMVVSGWCRRPGAAWLAAFTLVAALLANRFWDVPAGPVRFRMTNASFEHLGLTGAFALLGLFHLPQKASLQ